MKSKFYHPNIIWFGVWLAIFFVVLLIASYQNNLYWRGNLVKLGGMERATIAALLPYALTYAEENGRPDLLEGIINTDLGPYVLVITDPAGNITLAPQGLLIGKMGSGPLKGQEFFYILKDASSRRYLDGPYIQGREAKNSAAASAALGRLYLVTKKPYSFREALEQSSKKIFSPSESVFSFSLLSYIIVLGGFGGICAITARFQRHFQDIEEEQYQSELEAQELRIKILESNIKGADLRLELLDRRYEKAQSVLNAAKSTIAGLEMAIQYESSRNEELRDGLKIAEAERNEAIDTMQAIERDRERIAAEMRELEILREVEEMNRPDPAKEKARRPKEFLWLNMVYKNLYFSRRALQNIIELQNSPDIFPALPDALTTLNNTAIESLLNGEAVPSRSAVRYTQVLTHHDGDLWEYRFSKDGRIFFGLSKSKTWNVDTILLKRKFTENRYKYEKHLAETLGKDNNDLKPAFTPNRQEIRA